MSASTFNYVGFFTTWLRSEKKYSPVTVCTVCGNDTLQDDATNVSDDPEVAVMVGRECIMGWFAWNELQAVPSYVESHAALFVQEIEMVEQQTAVKYIRFNVSRSYAPTWVHIASGKPFELKPRRYGRYSSTLCGKEYEMDDYSTVKDEQEAKAHLCKRCANLAGIQHERLENQMDYESSQR